MNKLVTKIAILVTIMAATTNVANASKAQDTLDRAKSLYNQNTKNIPGALSCCNDAIRLDPKLADAYAWRASLYLELKQPQKAQQDFTAAIKLDPKDGFSYMGRGGIYMHQGDNQRALADYTAALKIYGHYTEALYERGVILNRQKKYKEALSDLNKAIEIDPKFGWAYYMRAQTYAKLGQHKLANRDKQIWEEMGADVPQ